MVANNDPRDGIAAARRAWPDNLSHWHPILAAVEVEPWVWHLVDEVKGTYGIVRALEVGGERGYRATTWDEDPARRRLIGFYRSLRGACMAVQQRFIAGHARKGGPDALGG